MKQMRIWVREKSAVRFALALSTKLLLNRMSAGIIARALHANIRFEQADLSARDFNRLFREILRMKKKHPGLTLVDVKSKDGDSVKIRL